MHGIAGFTAKSGGQAAVENVADPEGPAGRISSHRPAVSWGRGDGHQSARSDCAHWAFPAKRLWTFVRVQSLLKSSSASFWRKACAVGREKLAGAALCFDRAS